MKLSRYMIDVFRENAARFARETDSVQLMPTLPKRIILLCDTALALYDELDKQTEKPDV